MKEFKVNEYITLKLEDGETNIYVKGKLFDQCKYVLLRNTSSGLENTLESVESVDELAEQMDHSLEERLDHSLEEDKIESINIPLETIFWVHCSNLQVWAENDYDTRLIHSNLAFPLLKRLSKLGDPIAKSIFRKEIIKRLESGYENTIEFLIQDNYHKYLTKEQYAYSILDEDAEILLEIEAILGIELQYSAKYPKEKEFTVKNRRIIGLDLSFCELKNIPISVRKLTNLRAIKMVGNKLHELPNWLNELKNLEWIDLGINKIQKIPEFIKDLNKLEYLDLSDNEIQDIPNSMMELKNLKTLNIENNRLSKIPDFIKRLPKMEEIII